ARGSWNAARPPNAKGGTECAVRRLRGRLNDLGCGGADPSFKAQRGCRPAHLSKTVRPLERRSSAAASAEYSVRDRRGEPGRTSFKQSVTRPCRNQDRSLPW